MKMKKLILVGLFVLMSATGLMTQYLDVGDDSTKIQIASKKKIIYNGNPVVGEAWSHDGEWFLGGSKEGWLIMDKNGNFLQKIPRRFNFHQTTIFPDNKRIFYYFWIGKKHYYAIYNLETKQETLLSIDPLKEHFRDISPQGEILFVRELVISHKIKYEFVLFNPESGTKHELGTISGLDIYSEFGDFRFINDNLLLLLVRDQNEARLKKYDFSKQKLINIADHEFYFPTFKRLHDGRDIAMTVAFDAVCLYGTNGKLLGKFTAHFDRGGPDNFGRIHDLIPGGDTSDLALAPNGKLILVRMYDISDESGNPTDEVYLYNLQGKYVRFELPYPFGQMLWSPQGDRMLNGDLILLLRKTK